MPNNDVHPTRKTLEHWAHEGREWFNKFLVFAPIREEFVKTVGWERALNWGSSDWILGVDTPINQQDLTARLAKIFRENPKTIPTQIATLSCLIQKANAPCHEHDDQHDSADGAAAENARKTAACIVQALAQEDAGIKEVLQTQETTNQPDSTFFNVMALLAARYKTPFTWGAQELAKTALYPEKSVLKSKVFNRVAACVIAVSGTWGIGQRVAEMLHPQPEPAPITQLQGKPPIKQTVNIPEAAEQASLFVGAYLLGLYFSLSWSKEKLSPQQQKIRATALAGHISSEAGLTVANVFSSAVEGMQGVWDAVIAKQVTDSVLDVVVTGTTVKVAHTVLEGSKLPKVVQEKIQHQAAAFLSVFAAVGAHDTLGALQNILLPMYATVYAPFVAYKGVQYVAKNIEKPKFWQRVGLAAASLMMTFNMTGSMPLQQNVSVVPSSPVPTQRVAKQQPMPAPTVKQTPSRTVSITAGSSFNATLGKHLEPKMVAAVSTAFGTPDLVQVGEKIAVEQQKEGVEISFRNQRKIFNAAGQEILPKAAQTTFWAVGRGGTLTEAMQTTLAKAGVRNDAAFAYRALKEFQKYHGIDIDVVQAADATAVVRDKEGITLYLKKDGEVYSRTITEKPKQAEGVSPVMTLMQQAREAIGRG